MTSARQIRGVYLTLMKQLAGKRTAASKVLAVEPPKPATNEQGTAQDATKS